MNVRMLALASMVLALGLTSCGNDESEEEVNNTQELCFYSYDDNSTELGFTSYKTTAKVPVKGTFNVINIKGEESDNQMDLIKSLKFEIETASIETNDEGRNAKIVKFFFGTFGCDKITGSVANLDDDGSAEININMGGMNLPVSGKYKLDEAGKFEFTSNIDVADWNAQTGIDALNLECKDLHTGEDGVSKLWSEVDLYFSTILASDCD